jgi:hypothetical protein
MLSDADFRVMVEVYDVMEEVSVRMKSELEREADLQYEDEFSLLSIEKNHCTGKEILQSNTLENSMNNQCIISSLFTMNKNEEKIKQSLIERKIIKDLTIIGKGAVGVAIESHLTYKGKSQKLIIKTLHKLEKYAMQSILHEGIVGLKALNELRNNFSIPNFAYIYGVFLCYPAEIKNNKLMSFCGTSSSSSMEKEGMTKKGKKEKVYHVIYEHIEGEILEDAVKSMSFSEFMNMYIQVLLALSSAQLYFSYSHYDLHPGNIIMKKVSSTFYVPYFLREDKIYFEAFTLPTIIDFGSSYVKVNNKSYGYEHLSQNIFRDRMMPLFDAYTLLMSCLDIAMEDNIPLYNNIRELYFYFNKNAKSVSEQVINQFEGEPELFYHLPYTKNTAVDDREYKTFLSHYQIPSNYGKDILPHKLNDLPDFIEYCCDFCLEKGIEDPIVSEDYIRDTNGQVLFCEEGYICI